jgi:hypothetical protein
VAAWCRYKIVSDYLNQHRYFITCEYLISGILALPCQLSERYPCHAEAIRASHLESTAMAASATDEADYVYMKDEEAPLTHERPTELCNKPQKADAAALERRYIRPGQDIIRL